MIYYLVTKKHSYTISLLLTHWAREFKDRFEVMHYEVLLDRKILNPGTYIFTDIDRINPRQVIMSANLWSTFSKTPGFHPVNHPLRSMQRYELLRTLYESNINSFNIYRLNETRTPEKFPVYIRWEHEHDAISSLLKDQEELDATIRKFNGDLDGKVMVEICDTSDATGMFRKYASYIVGNRIIPIHIMYSNHWYVKSGVIDTESARTEEKAYIENNPHEDLLREIFQIARINYGRIDYSFIGDRIQVWEINTNPTLLPVRRSDQRIELKHFFLERYKEALVNLDTRCMKAAPEALPLTINWD